MITFKQFITEIASAKVDYEIDDFVGKWNNHFKATTTIENRKVVFSAIEEDQDEWHVMFTEVNKDGLGFHGRTNSGGEFRVAAFVVAAMKEFIAKKNPIKIHFVADKDDDDENDARPNVYFALVKRKFPEFKVTKRSGSAGSTYFQMVKEQLLEVADKKVEYEVMKETSDRFETFAKIGDRTVVFSAVDTKELHEGWDVNFHELSSKHGKTYKMSGSGNEFEVSAFILASFKEFIDRYNPSIISFSAAKEKEDVQKNTRAEVYVRLLRRHIPNYVIDIRDKPQIKHTLIYMYRKS